MSLYICIIRYIYIYKSNEKNNQHTTELNELNTHIVCTREIDWPISNERDTQTTRLWRKRTCFATETYEFINLKEFLVRFLSFWVFEGIIQEQKTFSSENTIFHMKKTS